MDIIDAYDSYCGNSGILRPSEKMKTLLKSKRRISTLEVSDVNIQKVHQARVSVVRLRKTEDPMGEGDKFKEWCKIRGRQSPSTPKVLLLNENPDEGRQAIHYDPDNPLVYRALCTYMAMGGMRDLHGLR